MPIEERDDAILGLEAPRGLEQHGLVPGDRSSGAKCGNIGICPMCPQSDTARQKVAGDKNGKVSTMSATQSEPRGVTSEYFDADQLGNCFPRGDRGRAGQEASWRVAGCKAPKGRSPLH